MWPSDAPDQGRVLLLADASSRFELSLIEEWAAAHRPDAVATQTVRLAPSRRRKPGQKTDPTLAALMSEDWYLLPVRVVWSPASRGPNSTTKLRRVSWLDVLKLGDPRDPDALRQRVIHRTRPDRVEIITGLGAEAASLRAETQGDPVEFVTRRAWRALDRSERALRGDRYKVPHFLHHEITSTPEFRSESIRLGAERNLAEAVAVARARYYLREIAAKHSPFVIDLFANIINWVVRQGYGSMIYDREQVAEISALGREWPLAFLPAHRSNLDRLTLQLLKWENDLPPNHTAGGINMNFFPVGPLVRRTGVFFIRRSFKDNELYKFVLRQYLDYLVENRFPAGVVPGRRPLPLGEAPPAKVRAPRLCRRLLEAGQVRRLDAGPGIDRLRPDPRRCLLFRPSPGRDEGERVLWLGAQVHQVPPPSLWQHPCPVRRTALGGQIHGRRRPC